MGVGEDHAGESLHMDHRAHHGGSLLMLGDHHLEVVEGAQTVELYVSDAARHPLRAVSATIVFDGGAEQALEWSGYRLVARKPAHYDWADYHVVLPNAPPLSIRLPSSGVTMPG
jgi:hypothetical protein